MTEDMGKVLLDSLFNGLWIAFKATWWCWLLLLIIYLITQIIPVLIDRKRRERKFAGIESQKSDHQILYDLRKLKPSEFEDYIADLYSRLGYKTERVGKSHDNGIDVVIEKDGVKHYIQCKKFITRKVSVGSVRDFCGSITSKLADGNGIFITTNFFTTEAKKFAEDNMIEPIDGYALLKLIKSTGNLEIKKDTINSEKEFERCPKCGGELILRYGKNGPFYGCSNFSKTKCKFTKDI